MKKVTIGSKPTARAGQNSPDSWVADRHGSGVPMKRLTIDVSLSLHQRLKSRCALKGVKMADAVRELLEAHFGLAEGAEAPKASCVPEMRKHDSVTFRNCDDEPG